MDGEFVDGDDDDDNDDKDIWSHNTKKTPFSTTPTYTTYRADTINKHDENHDGSKKKEISNATEAEPIPVASPKFRYLASVVIILQQHHCYACVPVAIVDEWWKTVSTTVAKQQQ